MRDFAQREQSEEWCDDDRLREATPLYRVDLDRCAQPDAECPELIGRMTLTRRSMRVYAELQKYRGSPTAGHNRHRARAHAQPPHAAPTTHAPARLVIIERDGAAVSMSNAAEIFAAMAEAVKGPDGTRLRRKFKVGVELLRLHIRVFGRIITWLHHLTLPYRPFYLLSREALSLPYPTVMNSGTSILSPRSRRRGRSLPAVVAVLLLPLIYLSRFRKAT